MRLSGMMLVLGLLASGSSASALTVGPNITVFDCTTVDGAGNCNGTYPTFQEIMGRVDYNVHSALAQVYSQAYSDYPVLWWSTGQPNSTHSYLKIVATQITRNGQVVDSYHAQVNNVPYAVVTTLNRTPFQVATAVSRQVDQMILDPHLNNNDGEVCSGVDQPAVYTQVAVPQWWWSWQQTIPDGPVCNFEINPGSGTYCSTHLTDPGC